MAFHGHTHPLTETQMSGMDLQLSMSAKVDDICDLKANFYINWSIFCYNFTVCVI